MPGRIRLLTVSIEERRYATAELAELAGLPAELVAELAHAGLLPTATRREPRFPAAALATARRARRLMRDFELDRGGLLLAMTLLGRIERLEKELRRMGCAEPRD